MEVILILLLIAGVGLGVAYICDPASLVSKEKAEEANTRGNSSKPVAIIITLVLVQQELLVLVFL